MPARSVTLAGVTLLAGCFLGVAAAPASAACDPYSTGCDGGGDIPNGGGGDTPNGGSGDASFTGDSGSGTTPFSGGEASFSGASGGGELPFTGAEVTLLGLVGAGALAGGTTLVLAGRRRSAASV